MRITITVDDLKRHGAYCAGLKRFQEVYGDVLHMDWTRETQIQTLLDQAPWEGFRKHLSWAVQAGLIPLWSMFGADLAGINLRQVELIGADMENANLTGACLAEVLFPGARLVNACLVDADLTNACLVGANLAGANLAGANLTNANLTGANLAGANLAGAQLEGVCFFRADKTDANWR